MMFPALKYQDAAAAIKWLCDVLGFQKKLVVPGENGFIAHAQLTLGSGMIMLGSENNNEFGLHVKPPKSLNNINTQVPYIYIDNIDEHYENALNSGADIVIALREEEYGGKHYLCRDPEGFLWSIGSYDPYSD